MIAAPLNPITGITINESDPIVINGYPNRNVAKLTYTLTPENPSYSKVIWTSTDNQVATVSNGTVSAAGKQGSCEIRLASACDENRFAAVEVTQNLNQLVEEIQFGNEDGVFNLQYMDILLVDPVMLPDNADNKGFTYEIIGDPEIATTYTTKDIINHKPGSVQVKISTTDGSNISKTVTVNFAEPDRTPLSDEYQDGTFWLNEEWYTHTNGSINYIDKDGELKYRVYESQNPYESFGATSCSAINYGGRIYVSSKQDRDAGDPRPGGGRLVIFDAKTLKKIASFKDLDANGGDGRSVVGVTPEKLYVGTTAGIKVLNVDNENNEFTLADSFIEGTGGGSSYAGQIGDMVSNGRYVFAVKQSTGVLVIDALTDQLVATISENNAVALTRSFDGDIWCASTKNLYHINTETLAFDQTYVFPSTFPQSWSAWRPSNLFASKNENVLYWGHSAGWNAGCDWIYRWEIGEEFPSQPIFNSPFPTYPGGKSANKAYAGGGYDSRTNTLLVASCSGAGTSARYNHINYIDGNTGELLKSVPMKDYFWFPSHPLFPDKYAPEYSDDFGGISIKSENDTYEIDLADIVSDDDHPFSWIKHTAEIMESRPYGKAKSGSEVANVEISDGKLTITPNALGQASVKLTAEANGKVTTKFAPIYVGAVTLIDGEEYNGAATVKGIEVNYAREFKHTNWQALYVPFDINYSEWSDYVEIAKFVGVKEFDQDNNVLEFETVSEGVIEANTPCVIRPRFTGNMTLASSSTTLSAAPEIDGSVTYTLGNDTYTLTGIYQPKSGLDGCYALKDGVFMKGESSDQVLSPNRIYLSIGTIDASQSPKRIAIVVDGETTGIDAIISPQSSDDAYNLRGQRVGDGYKGFVVRKGQKTLNK